MKPVQIGLCGLGVVGRGVLEILRSEQEFLRPRAGLDLRVRRVFDRSWRRKAPALGEIEATDNPDDVLNDPEIDIVVELMGGIDPARKIVKRAIENGKSVVTANKALLARHGNEIFGLARERKVGFGFEAAVAGGLPVIQNMRRGLIANEVRGICGILNGTCNFILTRMQDDGMDYDAALQQAQQLGFAERDPSFDVDGRDAAQKLAILSALAFDTAIREDAVIIEGIRQLRSIDLEFARSFGRVVRLLAVARQTEDEKLIMRVHPAMIPINHPLAAVRDEKNAVFFDASNSGPTLITGSGAGARPTAAAVISDLVFLSRSRPDSSEIWLSGLDLPEMHSDFWYRTYLRFQTRDQPGVLAEITRVLAAGEISIASVRQPETEEPVQVVVTTHEAQETRLQEALAHLNQADFMLAPAVMVRLEDGW
ncbi:MAG: homoserine dehydrogenase [Leptospirales bacterium]|nr:homoserine dehydrogenase [Leptospirales bacterium]